MAIVGFYLLLKDPSSAASRLRERFVRHRR
jgi:hypothetical protein